MKYFAFIVAITLLASCGSSKETKTPMQVQEQLDETYYTGIVQEIERGKDGYTAKIKTEKGEVFYATVSISNLKEASQYKSVEPGTTIKVKGEHWKMEDQNRITAREFYIVEI